MTLRWDDTDVRGLAVGNSGQHPVSPDQRPLGGRGKQTRLDRPAASNTRPWSGTPDRFGRRKPFAAAASVMRDFAATLVTVESTLTPDPDVSLLMFEAMSSGPSASSSSATADRTRKLPRPVSPRPGRGHNPQVSSGRSASPTRNSRPPTQPKG